MMKLYMAAFILLISALAQAQQVDYKFCQQTLQKVAVDNGIPWVFKKSFSNTSTESFQFEEGKVKPDSDAKVEIVPTLEDHRLSTVKIRYQMEMCKDKAFGLVHTACKSKTIDFKVDPQSNPCQFESITFAEQKEKEVERKPIMAKSICGALRDYRKSNPGSDLNDFELKYLQGAKWNWRDEFKLVYSPNRLRSDQLTTLEKNCQAYSPAETGGGAPAAATGRGAVAPKTQSQPPAAK
jgi:hypothetical protein